MLKIYHNPKCKRSREGLEFLKSISGDYIVVDYMKNGLSKAELKEILLKTNLKPIDIVRKQEDIFKKELKGKSFNNEEWINIICENPKLLQRPIVIGKNKAVVGLPVERIEEVMRGISDEGVK
jgi:arsenate reductase (glutaredoxin)